MLQRTAIALGLGLCITSSLFWCLSLLIRRNVDLVDRVAAVRIEFARLRRDTDVKTIQRQKAQLEKPSQGPTVPRTATVMSATSETSDVALLDATLGSSFDVRAGVRANLGNMVAGLGGSDRDVMPLVRIEPDYPNRALSRGLEGWVLVQFTITPAGTVRDARVIDAEPKGIFDVAAVKAVERWKYNPKVENGMAVERRGIQVMLTFQVEK